jgi:hypothetical protein
MEGKIEFPGLGNTWKAALRDLPISSGVASPPETNGDQGVNEYDIAVPPWVPFVSPDVLRLISGCLARSYWEVMGEDGGESKDEKR